MRVHCPVCGEVERLEDVVGSLAEVPADLERLLNDLDDLRASARPEPSEWSAREVLAHLTDTEVIRSYRFLKIVSEETPAVEPYDEVVWGKAGAYERRDIPTLLAGFSGLRRSWLDLIGQLPPGAL